jgi:hypothetical protein
MMLDGVDVSTLVSRVLALCIILLRIIKKKKKQRLNNRSKVKTNL